MPPDPLEAHTFGALLTSTSSAYLNGKTTLRPCSMPGLFVVAIFVPDNREPSRCHTVDPYYDPARRSLMILLFFYTSRNPN